MTDDPNNSNNDNKGGIPVYVIIILVIIIIAVFIFIGKLLDAVESVFMSDDFKDDVNHAVTTIQQETYDSKLEALTGELAEILEQDDYVQYDVENGIITIDIFDEDLYVPEEELDATRYGIDLFGIVPDTLFNQIIHWYNTKGEYPYVILNMCDAEGHILYKLEGDSEIEENYYAVLSGGVGELVNKTYLYMDNGEYKYIQVQSHTTYWGSTEWVDKVTKVGKLTWPQQVIDVAKENGSDGWVKINVDIPETAHQKGYNKGDLITINELRMLISIK